MRKLAIIGIELISLGECLKTFSWCCVCWNFDTSLLKFEYYSRILVVAGFECVCSEDFIMFIDV